MFGPTESPANLECSLGYCQGQPRKKRLAKSGFQMTSVLIVAYQRPLNTFFYNVFSLANVGE